MKRFFAVTAVLAGAIAIICAIYRRKEIAQKIGCSGAQLQVKTPASITVVGKATPVFWLDLWSKLSESLCTFATAAALLWKNRKKD